MKVSSPAQTRDSRIKQLISIAEAILEGGASQHLLYDKLERASFRLWPGLREETRRSYIVSAMKVVMSQPPIASDFLIEGVPPQEAT